MIGYMPTIYPDELVYSWFCRYYVHSGYLTHQMALSDLYNKCSNNPSKEFIGFLNSEAQRTITGMYSMEELILEHTMFPQYARFIPKEQKQTALRRLASEHIDTHHVFAILPRGVGEEYLKYCPLCVAEDRDKYGETYWHRRHQIRGINLCVKHKCSLEDSDVIATSHNTFRLCAAEFIAKDMNPRYDYSPTLLSYAEYVESVFDAPIDFKANLPISEVLYHGIKNTTYMKSTGKTKYSAKLTEDVNRYYKEMGIHNIVSYHQLIRTMAGTRFDFSIVCQLAFYLNLTVEELTESKLTSKQIKMEEEIHNKLETATIDWDKYDLEFLNAFEQTAKAIYNGELNVLGRPERVGERSICRALNIPVHRLTNMPRCKAVFDKYTESYEENFARRIVWAYKFLLQEKTREYIYWYELRDKSGVKKINARKAVAYINKYADDRTVDSIIQLING